MTHHTCVIDGLLCLHHEDGDGIDCHELLNQADALKQIARWQSVYDFDAEDSAAQIKEYFTLV